MDRRKLLERLDREWQAVLQSFQDVPDEAMLEPGVVGEWSMKDLLGHITTWEDEAIKALDVMMQGKRTPRYKEYGGIDAFNARESAKKANLSLEEVQKQLGDTHHRLVAQVPRMPEEHWVKDTRVRRRLRIDTYGHYRKHYPQVQARRKEKGL